MNFKPLCLVLAVCLCGAPHAYAQKQLKHVAKGLEKTAARNAAAQAAAPLRNLPAAAAGTAARAGRPVSSKRARQLQVRLEKVKSAARMRIAEKVRVKAPAGYLSRAAKEELKRQRMAAFDAHAEETTALIQDPSLQFYAPFPATAFFIEHMFGGKKQIWGVTSAHIADIMGPEPTVSLTLETGFRIDFPVKFAIKGNAGMADLALFPVESEMAEFIRPIPLAQTPPAPQEKLRSYGYFNNDFHIVRGRAVLANTPGRIVTSFEFGKTDRAGACGGPVLNENNELVGVHCGSSESKQESYAVPVSHLKDLLHAVYHGGYRLRPLVLNGQKVGDINVDEYIYSLNVKKRGSSLHSIQPWHREAEVDYEHLEKLLSLKGADEVEILLVKSGTVQTGADANAVKTIISVNLKTGEVSRARL